MSTGCAYRALWVGMLYPNYKPEEMNRCSRDEIPMTCSRTQKI